MEAIREWAASTTDARVVVIDVFTKIRPEPNSSDTAYDAHHKALGPLKALADEAGIAVVTAAAFTAGRDIGTVPTGEMSAAITAQTWSAEASSRMCTGSKKSMHRHDSVVSLFLASEHGRAH